MRVVLSISIAPVGGTLQLARSMPGDRKRLGATEGSPDGTMSELDRLLVDQAVDRLSEGDGAEQARRVVRGSWADLDSIPPPSDERREGTDVLPLTGIALGGQVPAAGQLSGTDRTGHRWLCPARDGGDLSDVGLADVRVGLGEGSGAGHEATMDATLAPGSALANLLEAGSNLSSHS